MADKLSINNYENREASLTRPDDLKRVDSSIQLDDAIAVVEKGLWNSDLNQSDADIAERHKKLFWWIETELLQRPHKTNPWEMEYVLAHNGQEIIVFNNEALLKEFMKRYTLKYTMSSLKQHSVDVKLILWKELIIDYTKEETTHLSQEMVIYSARDARANFKKLQRKVNSHLSILWTPNIKETKTEIAVYKMFKQQLQEIQWDINRIENDTLKLAKQSVTPSVVLNAWYKELKALNDELLEIDKLLHDEAALKRFKPIMDSSRDSLKRVYTITNLKALLAASDAVIKWRVTLPVEVIKDQIEDGWIWKRDPNWQRYFEETADWKMQCYTRDQYGKPRKCGQPIIKNDGTLTENLLSNLSNAGLINSVWPLMINISESISSSYGYWGKLSNDQKKFLNVLWLAWGLYLWYRAIKWARNWLWKLTGDWKWNDWKRYEKLWALALLEWASIMLLQTSPTMMGAKMLFGWKWGWDKVYGLTNNLGLTNYNESEQWQPVQLSNVSKLFWDMSCSQIAPFIVRSSGKPQVNWPAYTKAYPQNKELAKKLSKDPDVIANTFAKLNISQEDLEGRYSGMTFRQICMEHIKENLWGISWSLEARWLEIKEPHLQNFMVVIDTYDKTKSDDENIAKWLKEGLLSKPKVEVVGLNRIKDVSALTAWLTLADIKPYIKNNATNKEDIDMVGIRDYLKSQWKTAQWETFYNKHGANSATIFKDVLDLSQLTLGTPPALDDATKQATMFSELLSWYEQRETRKQTWEIFLKEEWITCSKDALKQVFIDNLALKTPTEMKAELQKVLADDANKDDFQFDISRVGFLEGYTVDQTTLNDEISNLQSLNIDSTVTPIVPGLTEKLNIKEKSILAALKLKLATDYSPYKIEYKNDWNWKLELDFNWRANRKDRDWNIIPWDNKSTLVINPRNFTVDWLSEKSGKLVSFKDENRADQWLSSMILWAFQYGMTRDLFEGQSTIPGSTDWNTWPFEKEWFGKWTNFREASFWQKRKHNLLTLWREIPVIWDALEVFTKYGRDVFAGSVNQIHILETAEWQEATRRFYNKQTKAINWKEVSIWTSSKEQTEIEKYEAKWTRLHEQWVVNIAWEKLASLQIKDSIVSLYKTYTPEVVQKILTELWEWIYEIWSVSRNALKALWKLALAGAKYPIATVENLAKALAAWQISDILREAWKVTLVLWGIVWLPAIAYITASWISAFAATNAWAWIITTLAVAWGWYMIYNKLTGRFDFTKEDPYRWKIENMDIEEGYRLKKSFEMDWTHYEFVDKNWFEFIISLDKNKKITDYGTATMPRPSGTEGKTWMFKYTMKLSWNTWDTWRTVKIEKTLRSPNTLTEINTQLSSKIKPTWSTLEPDFSKIFEDNIRIWTDSYASFIIVKKTTSFWIKEIPIPIEYHNNKYEIKTWDVTRKWDVYKIALDANWNLKDPTL